jgi:hypothetical protein
VAREIATTLSTGPATGPEIWTLWRAWYERKRAEKPRLWSYPPRPPRDFPVSSIPFK